MTRWLSVLAPFACVLWMAGAWGQNSYDPIVLRVACGGVAKDGCAKVVPRIAARTVRSGVDLKPSAGGIPLDSLTAVCEGQVAAAVVQHDVIARFATCKDRYDIVGRPLYPFYAFLVVRSDTPFHQLDDMASGKRRRLIMAGAEGTGGQITLGFVLRSNPNLQRFISVATGDPEVALQHVADGSIDGWFAVEPLGSETIDRVRRKADAHGKPLYTFIDIRPAQQFFQTGDGAGHCLYRLTALDFGAAEPVTTVSLDAVMLLARPFSDAHARGGPRAADALASAIEQAQTAILADTRSPSDWHPVGTSCQ